VNAKPLGSFKEARYIQLMPAARKAPVYRRYSDKLDIKAELAALDRAYKRAARTKASAIRFLQEAGILDATGKLAKEYR
jgi:hypothetical protein